jgi:hypothetical protein
MRIIGSRKISDTSDSDAHAPQRTVVVGGPWFYASTQPICWTQIRRHGPSCDDQTTLRIFQVLPSGLNICMVSTP